MVVVFFLTLLNISLGLVDILLKLGFQSTTLEWGAWF